MLKKLLNNLGLKILALVIASILWAIVSGKEYRYGDFNIPVAMVGLPDNLVISGFLPDDNEIKNATVRIRASETAIRNIDERTMYLSVDLDGYDNGVHKIILTDDMVKGKPPGAEITDITPADLEIEIEEKIYRSNVPAYPSLLGTPEDGYDIYDSYCMPRTVSLEGPKSKVEEIEKINTSPVRIEGLNKSLLQRDLTLVSPDRRITVIPDRVDLRVIIGEKIISRTLENIDVKIPAGFRGRINPPAISVTVRGPLSQVDKLGMGNLSVWIQIPAQSSLNRNIRIDDLQLKVTPPDSFPDVSVERFSQGFIDVWLTGRPNPAK